MEQAHDGHPDVHIVTAIMGPNVRDPHTPVTLPPETLDEALGHILPTTKEGRRTLIACALVATWWTGPSQRRLFSSISIHENNHERWMDDVVLPRSSPHLLEHVRTLNYRRGSPIIARYPIRDLTRDSGEYLSGLRNLRSLTLSNVRLEHIGEDGFRTCFSAFRETLTDLFLENFATSFSAFATLVDYFPNIRTLRLHLSVLEPDGRPAPSLSRPLRGKIHFDCVQDDSFEFSNQFSKLDLEYEELVVASSIRFVETRYLQSALQISASTVKVLRLMVESRAGPPTISGFRQLQELELVVNWPGTYHDVLLSSITSIDLRRIIFYEDDWRSLARDMDAWAPIDKQLCVLVGRLREMGCYHTPEAELKLAGVGDDSRKYDFAKFLPRFRKKVAHGPSFSYHRSNR